VTWVCYLGALGRLGWEHVGGVSSVPARALHLTTLTTLRLCGKVDEEGWVLDLSRLGSKPLH
jgi:hypothetical protein